MDHQSDDHRTNGIKIKRRWIFWIVFVLHFASVTLIAMVVLGNAMRPIPKSNTPELISLAILMFPASLLHFVGVKHFGGLLAVPAVSIFWGWVISRLSARG